MVAEGQRARNTPAAMTRSSHDMPELLKTRGRPRSTGVALVMMSRIGTSDAGWITPSPSGNEEVSSLTESDGVVLHNELRSHNQRGIDFPGVGLM